MTVPLVILAICAVAVGAYVEMSHAYTFLWHTPSLTKGDVGATAAGLLAKHGHLEMHMDVAALSTIVALAGIGLAAFMYLGKRTEAEQVAEFTSTRKGLWLYRLSLNKFYFDELYAFFIVWPLRGLAALSYVFDRLVVDGLVNFCGWVPRVVGALFRSLQTGMVQFYALAMVLGMLVLFASLRFTSFFNP
jgi:NADH:ubiquinone oxidoreductase subunit 5 (subunit L)/multisubunit Na+/H+ antiporter MnhA subunit